MHYKGGVAEIDQAWSWRLRQGVTGGVVGDSLNKNQEQEIQVFRQRNQEGRQKGNEGDPDSSSAGKRHGDRSQCGKPKAGLVGKETRTKEKMAKMNKDKSMVWIGE